MSGPAGGNKEEILTAKIIAAIDIMLASFLLFSLVARIAANVPAVVIPIWATAALDIVFFTIGLLAAYGLLKKKRNLALVATAVFYTIAPIVVFIDLYYKFSQLGVFGLIWLVGAAWMARELFVATQKALKT